MANKHLILGTRMALGLSAETEKAQPGEQIVWNLLTHSAKVSIVMRMLSNEQKRATSNTLHILLNRKWEEIPAAWQDRLYKINWGAPVMGAAIKEL